MAITWDVRMPYGCKLMGFRSKVLPSLEVLRTDGRHCSGFSAKPTPAHAQANVNAKAQTQGQGASIKPTQAVGKASDRRDSDRRGPFTPINVIT